jgi:hypothetical protein
LPCRPCTNRPKPLWRLSGAGSLRYIQPKPDDSKDLDAEASQPESTRRCFRMSKDTAARAPEGVLATIPSIPPKVHANAMCPEGRGVIEKPNCAPKSTDRWLHRCLRTPSVYPKVHTGPRRRYRFVFSTGPRAGIENSAMIPMFFHAIPEGVIWFPTSSCPVFLRRSRRISCFP